MCASNSRLVNCINFSMNSNLPITHAIFDLDGLLIDTEKIYTEVTSNFLANYGKTYTYEIKRQLMGRKSEEAAQILIDNYNLPLLASDVVRLVHKGITPESWHKAFLLPGAVDLINYLSAHAIPMAIATGSEKCQIEHKMYQNKDIWKQFHHVVVSGGEPDIIHGKPAPDIFNLALKRFNDPTASPLTTIVFEDAWNGVVAALSAGMRVVWVPDPREAAGFPDTNLSEDEICRITRLSSLTDFRPELFKLPT